MIHDVNHFFFHFIKCITCVNQFSQVYIGPGQCVIAFCYLIAFDRIVFDLMHSFALFYTVVV